MSDNVIIAFLIFFVSFALYKFLTKKDNDNAETENSK
jgi:hypothetical protein